MKEFDKNKFDEIFRAGLTAPDLSEVDEDWELMKARLQKDRSRKLVPYYLIMVSSVAAVMLLVFSVVFNSDYPVKDKSAINTGSDETTAPAAELPVTDQGVTGSVPEMASYEQAPKVALKPEVVSYTAINTMSEYVEPVQNERSGELPVNVINSPVDAASNSVPLVQVLTSESADTGTGLASSSAIREENPAVSQGLINAGGTNETNEKSKLAKSRISLAINLAPDMNGVEQFQSNKISYSIGAGLIYNISNKLSIEAGAAYGKKSYQTGFSSFRPVSYNLFQVKPNVVSSGFDIMDIQLNLAYTLVKKGKSSIGIGAGISSYLMLDEQYSFTYQNIHARGLSSFNTGYQNNHFFGIANLNLSYKRNVTNNVKLAFNPYLKLPLTELGYGNIRLRSAGMSVGVITNLNKSKK